MNIWPWSRFTWYENQIQGLCNQLEAATAAEYTLQDKLDAQTSTLGTVRRLMIKLATDKRKAELERDACKAELEELKKQFAGTGTQPVLHPPTEYKRLNDPTDEQFTHEPLDNLVNTGWPFGSGAL